MRTLADLIAEMEAARDAWKLDIAANEKRDLFYEKEEAVAKKMLSSKNWLIVASTTVYLLFDGKVIAYRDVRDAISVSCEPRKPRVKKVELPGQQTLPPGEW